MDEIKEGPEIWDFLAEIWRAMKRSVALGLHTEGILPGGLNVMRKARHLFMQEKETVNSQAERGRNLIVLMHDTNSKGKTVEMLPDAIDYIRRLKS